MAPDDIKKRIVNEIKARGYDDKYIDKAEEREIIQIAIQLGVTVESALEALDEVCTDASYVLESKLFKQIEEQVAMAAAEAGLVDQADFERICHTIRGILAGKKTDREIQKMIVTVMEKTGNNKVKRKLFRNWYSSLKHELGMS